MALGGGTFVAQNKTIPGAYINFVAASGASAALSERGTAALLLPCDWNHGKVVEITAENTGACFSLFGKDYRDEAMRPLREALCHANRVLVVTVGHGAEALSEVGSARFTGGFGNGLSVNIARNTAWTAENYKIDIETYANGVLVDRQVGVDGRVPQGEIRDNDYVIFTPTATFDQPGTYNFSGGITSDAEMEDWQAGLDLLESYSFHTLACGSEDDELKALFCNYTKRLRDECGMKFQCVISGVFEHHEGIVNAPGDAESVYWIAGAIAGCAVNESLTNAVYDGELTITPLETRTSLSRAVENGEFVFHSVSGEIRVLCDLNTSTHAVLRQNQTVRVLDQIANDIALTFREHYLGKIRNNRNGRMSFWNDVVRQHKELAALGAIEDFAAEDVSVEVGSDKTAIVVHDQITPVCGMEKLYMTVTVL